MARASGSRTARAARWAMGASPARAMSTAVPEALEFGKAIVWGKGSLGMRPSEGMQGQLDNFSMAPLKPTPLNTLTDQRITDVSPASAAVFVAPGTRSRRAEAPLLSPEEPPVFNANVCRAPHAGKWGSARASGTSAGALASAWTEVQLDKPPTCCPVSCLQAMPYAVMQMTFSLTGGAAVTEGGKLWTWGTNKHVLGLGGKVVSVPVPRPVKALADTNVVQVALGDKHGAAIGEGGFLFTWGYGGFPFWRQGALGHGDRVDQPQPAVVEAFREKPGPPLRARL